MAEDFRDQFKVGGRIWLDRYRKTYAQLHFTRGAFRTLLDPRAALNAARALSKGFMQGRTQGDAFQQGGVLVVKQGGEPVYFYASKVAGDMPPTSEVIGAAMSAGSQPAAPATA